MRQYFFKATQEKFNYIKNSNSYMPKAAITKLKDNQGTKRSNLQYLQQRVNILDFRQTIQMKYNIA